MARADEEVEEWEAGDAMTRPGTGSHTPNTRFTSRDELGHSFSKQREAFAQHESFSSYRMGIASRFEAFYVIRM